MQNVIIQIQEKCFPWIYPCILLQFHHFHSISLIDFHALFSNSICIIFFIHFALFYLPTYLSIIARSFALSLVYSLGLTNKSFLVVSFGCMLFSVCRLTDTEIYVNDDGSYWLHNLILKSILIPDTFFD